MVLAAGVGSRLDPLTTQLPKPLVPVANRPVMQHILALLKKHRFEDVISNLHYQPEKIEQYFGNGSHLGLNLEFRTEKELSGDAGGVRACRDFLGSDTFVVLMGDLLTDTDLTRIVEEHKRKKALATIAVKQVEDVSQFGVAIFDQNGFIKGFQEKPAAEEALSNFASTGIYILEPEVFDYMPKTGSYGFGRQLFPTLVDRGLPVLAVEIKDYWSDVGTITQYKLSNFDALRGDVQLHLPPLTGVLRCQLERNAKLAPGVKLEGHLLLGRNSTIGSGTKIRGHVIIGDNCFIDSNVVLENTVIWSGSTVERGARLVNCVVGADCVVGNGETHIELATVTSTQTALTRTAN